MKSVSLIMSFILVFLFVPQLNAQRTCSVDRDYYYHHNNRKYKQERKSIIDFRKRIDKGVWSGELTQYEEQYLKRRLNKLVRTENRAYANRYISHIERRKIEKRKRKLYREIYNKTHNRHVRY